MAHQEEQKTWDHKMKVDFLVSPTQYVPGYKSSFVDVNTTTGAFIQRAIPFEHGPFGDNEFVSVNKNGNEVTFRIQEGSVSENGVNGTHIGAMILFAKTFLETKNVGSASSRYNSMAITDLENANLHLFVREVELAAKSVHGTK
jgi:hypothetical protein